MDYTLKQTGYGIGAAQSLAVEAQKDAKRGDYPSTAGLPTIPEVISVMEQEVSVLEEQVTNLYVRVSPILHEVPPQPGNAQISKDPEERDGRPLSRLIYLTQRIRNLSAAINQTVGRIQL